jgi:hypothetical protein
MKKCAFSLTLLLISCGGGSTLDQGGTADDPEQRCTTYPVVVSAARACSSSDECSKPVSPCAVAVCRDGDCIEG